jgi:hypothetical protein
VNAFGLLSFDQVKFNDCILGFSDEVVSGVNEGVWRGQFEELKKFRHFVLVDFCDSLLPLMFGQGQKCRELVEQFGIAVID